MPPDQARQFFQTYADRCELVAVGIIDVTVPKLLGEAETRGKVENDIRVRPGFAGRRNDQNTAVGDVGHGPPTFAEHLPMPKV